MIRIVEDQVEEITEETCVVLWTLICKREDISELAYTFYQLPVVKPY